MGSKQTERQYNDKTFEKRKKEKKHHPVHNFNANSPLIIELVEHDNLWTNDDLRCLSSMSNADKPIPTWIWHRLSEFQGNDNSVASRFRTELNT